MCIGGGSFGLELVTIPVSLSELYIILQVSYWYWYFTGNCCNYKLGIDFTSPAWFAGKVTALKKKNTFPDLFSAMVENEMGIPSILGSRKHADI